MLRKKVIKLLCDLIVNEVPVIVSKLQLPQEMEYRVTYLGEKSDCQHTTGEMTSVIQKTRFGKITHVDKDSLTIYIYVDTKLRKMKNKYSSVLLMFPFLGAHIIKKELTELLAHKYRHLWQYYTGWILKHGQVDEYLPYEWRSVEKDANAWATKYMKGGE